MSLKDIQSDETLKETLKLYESDKNKIIVLDFYADWCRPCKRVEPALKQLSNQYRSVSFFKVDVDECSEAAQDFHIASIPTFVFLRGGQQVGLIKSVDVNVLRKKLDELSDGATKATTGSSAAKTTASVSIAPVAGFMDLEPLLQRSNCECLNCDSEHNLDCLLSKDMTYMESDTDEQLIIYLAFLHNVKLHSLRLSAPEDTGPKVVKLFINQPNTPDFDACELGASTETLMLTPHDLKKGVVRLRYVKFQNVSRLTIFVHNNQNGSDKTRITNLSLFGNPVNTVDMNDFKRVAGKKGEAHG